MENIFLCINIDLIGYKVIPSIHPLFIFYTNLMKGAYVSSFFILVSILAYLCFVHQQSIVEKMRSLYLFSKRHPDRIVIIVTVETVTTITQGPPIPQGTPQGTPQGNPQGNQPQPGPSQPIPLPLPQGQGNTQGSSQNVGGGGGVPQP